MYAVLTLLLLQLAITAQAQSAPEVGCPIPVGVGIGQFPFVSMCPDGVRFVAAYRSDANSHVFYSLYNGINNPVVQDVDLGSVGAPRLVAVDGNRVGVFVANGANGWAAFVNCDDGTNSGQAGTINSLDYYRYSTKLYYVASQNKVLIASWNSAKMYDVTTNTGVSVSGGYTFIALPMANGNFIIMRQDHPAFGGVVFINEFTYANTQVGGNYVIGDNSDSPQFAEVLDNGNIAIVFMRNNALQIRVHSQTGYTLVGTLSNILPANGGSETTYEKMADGKLLIIMSSEYNQMVVINADGLSVYATYSYTTGNQVVIRRDALGFVQVQQQSATNHTIQILRFDMSGSYRCNTASDCSCPSGVCGMNTCENQVCGVAFRPSTHVCRASNPLSQCDPEEYCTGTSNDCPADVVSGGASSCEDVNGDPVCFDDGSVGTVFHLKCVFPYNEGRGLVLSAEGLVGGTIGSVGRIAFPQGQSGCPRPDLTATPEGVNTPWTFTYDFETCKYSARLTIAPNSIPTNWLFSNGSNAIAVGSDATYNLITVPVNVATTTLIGATEVTIDNRLYSYTLRLPRVQSANATRYALKMFKLSDNDRGTLLVGHPGVGFAFSAIMMGGLTSGANRHVIQGTPVFVPDPSSPALTCTVEAEIYVYCGPFIDTNAPAPVAISGVLEVTARCLDVDCVPRVLYLPVTFLAGDYETTVDGAWSALAPLIWRRLENNDALDVELTNDVIVGGDKLVLSVHFDEGSLTTLTKLTATVTGFSGAGSTLVEYTNTAFVIHDTNPSNPVSSPTTIIKNQAQQAEIDSFFRFPSSYGINFAVQWTWPTTLPTDYRGTFHVDAFFDITYDARRRQEGSDERSLVLVQGPRSAVGDVESAQVILITDAAPALHSVFVCVASVLAAVLLL